MVLMSPSIGIAGPGGESSSLASCRPWASYSRATVTCKMGMIMINIPQKCCED